MAVTISPYSEELKERFGAERERLLRILGDEVAIEHIGSSAVGIGGKNIVDILIGAEDLAEMRKIRDILSKNGYFEGRGAHTDRIFMATSEEETGEGDFHIHICLRNSDTFRDFVTLRDFLLANPEVAKEYYDKKQELADLAGHDREKYKALKAEYVTGLLSRARKSPQ